jgi:hypothetical protein
MSEQVGFLKGAAPSNDEEVATLIQQYQHDNVRESLSGIYRIHRANGDEVLEAWLKTLQAHLDSFQASEENTL